MDKIACGDSEAGQVYNEKKMIEVVGGQKIWPGFTPRALLEAMAEAGCVNVEVSSLPETFVFPKDAEHSEPKRVLFARGFVS